MLLRIFGSVSTANLSILTKIKTVAGVRPVENCRSLTPPSAPTASAGAPTSPFAGSLHRRRAHRRELRRSEPGRAPRVVSSESIVGYLVPPSLGSPAAPQQPCLGTPSAACSAARAPSDRVRRRPHKSTCALRTLLRAHARNWRRPRACWAEFEAGDPPRGQHHSNTTCQWNAWPQTSG